MSAESPAVISLEIIGRTHLSYLHLSSAVHVDSDVTLCEMYLLIRIPCETGLGNEKA
jgi:hypothetical protein